MSAQDKKFGSFLTVDDALDLAWSPLGAHSEYNQQLAVFLVIAYKFKYSKQMLALFDDYVEDLRPTDRADLSVFVNAIDEAMGYLTDPVALRKRVIDMHVEWYYLSVLESVFVNTDELERFLVWVDVNKCTHPFNRAFVMYLDHIYGVGK